MYFTYTSKHIPGAQHFHLSIFRKIKKILRTKLKISLTKSFSLMARHLVVKVGIALKSYKTVGSLRH